MKSRKILALALAVVMLLACMAVTVVAGGDTTYDYSLVLCDGVARKNNESGDDVTPEMASAGLTYADGAWTMNNFNFKTTAAKAVKILSATTINVIGNNTITGLDSGSNSSPCGIRFEYSTTFQGTGSLTVTAGAGEGTSRGLSMADDVALVFNDLTFTANGGNCVGFNSFGFDTEQEGVTVTVNDANVTFNGGAVTGSGKESTGMYAGSIVIVNGNGKLTGNGKTSESGSVYGILGTKEESQAVATDADGNALTWDDYDYVDAQGNTKTTVILTAKNPPATPEITNGGTQTVDVTKEETATFETNIANDKLSNIIVDGTDVDAANYTLSGEAAATVVTLSKDFIATLADGTHTISIVSKYGNADSSFNVTRSKVEETSTEAPKATEAPAEPAKKSSNGWVIVLIIIIIIIIVAAILAFLFRDKLFKKKG